MDVRLKHNWLLIAVLAFFLLAIPYSMINQPTGPVGEVVGVIETYGLVGKDSSLVATVKLDGGELVQAEVLSGISASKGSTVHLRVYHRLISDTAYYEVFRTSAPEDR